MRFSQKRLVTFFSLRYQNLAFDPKNLVVSKFPGGHFFSRLSRSREVCLTADNTGPFVDTEFLLHNFLLEIGTIKFFGSNAKFWYLKLKKVTRAFWENCVWSYTMILCYNAPKNHQKSTFCQFSPTRPSHSPIWYK